MDALSIATAIVTFVDFGTKLVSSYNEIKRSNDGRPSALAGLQSEARDLSVTTAHARDSIASLQTKYPHRSEALGRLASDCTLAEKQLGELVENLTATPDPSKSDLRNKGARAWSSFRGLLKQEQIKSLESQLQNIRDQTNMSVILCIADDTTEIRKTFGSGDGGVGQTLERLEALEALMKSTVDRLEIRFHGLSGGNALQGDHERSLISTGLWTSIVTASCGTPRLQQSSPGPEEFTSPDAKICERITEGLQFQDMMAREDQIQEPFPETFRWILGDQGHGSSESPASEPSDFERWLESDTSQVPFWISGIPASGKSTLMKFICTKCDIEPHLKIWAGERGLVKCSVYFWSPGASVQKSQRGLLLSMLHQLLSQRPQLCPVVTPRRYKYYQLAGGDAPDPPAWELAELRDCIVSFVSYVEENDRVCFFIDALDEYGDDQYELVKFLMMLNSHDTAKLCVSSRPWNVFRDAFKDCPTLKMEYLTKPDIEKYVRTRIGDSPAFQELRTLQRDSVEDLESQIIDRASGVFLWVVLVVERLVTMCQNNNNLRTIYKELQSLPPGLDELYGSMRSRLSSETREEASKMYQLLLRWSEVESESIPANSFWMAIECQNPLEIDYCGMIQDALHPVLERRLIGTTGGMVHLVDHPRASILYSVTFLHRTVFDWIKSIRTTIAHDGPVGYDPGIILAAVAASAPDFSLFSVFSFGRTCNDYPESRKTLLELIHSLPIDLYNDMEYGSFDKSKNLFLYALQIACLVYVRARLEEGSADFVESSLLTRFLPAVLVGKGWRKPVPVTLRAMLDPTREDVEDSCRGLNSRLKMLELVLSSNSPPRRVLKKYANEMVGQERWPRKYWLNVQVILGGQNVIDMVPTDIEWQYHKGYE